MLSSCDAHAHTERPKLTLSSPKEDGSTSSDCFESHCKTHSVHVSARGSQKSSQPLQSLVPRGNDVVPPFILFIMVT